MSEIKWISIATDIFNDEKMCAIESLPDGLTIELVWFKLLCLAGICNENGFLMISRDIPYTDEMMAKNFRMEVGIIQRALETFQKMGMVEIIDDIYMVSNWLKYQNGTELEHIKLLNRTRQQRYRDKQKESLLIPDNATNNVTDNVINNDFCSMCNMSYVEVFKEIVSYLNTKCNRKYSPKASYIKSLIKARIREGHNIDDFKHVIDVKAADWLNDKEMNKYLRPETLFAAKHFDSYVNQEMPESDESRWEAMTVGRGEDILKAPATNRDGISN